MPKNYWMFVQTRDNFEISKKMGLTLHGLMSRQRRRAQRMEPGDRALFYIAEDRKWAAAASITSGYFEDRTHIWESNGGREQFPYRVKVSPTILLREEDYIDGLELGPRLEYVKKWVPESWYLAFIDTLHLLPQKDFRLIEGEMKRITGQRRRKRRRGRYRREGGAAGKAFTREGAPGEGPTGEGAAGDAPTGEGAAGDAPTGEGAAGDAPAGEGAAGDAPAGEGAAGDAPTGEGAAGDAPTGEGAAGEGPAGEGAAGEGPAGEGAEGDILTIEATTSDAGP